MWFKKHRETVDKSKEALAESIEKLQQTEMRTAAVSEVSTALRSLRERNHFAEQLESIMGGPK
jgi:hypothetical protein